MRLGHGGIVDQMNEDMEKTRAVTKCKNDGPDWFTTKIYHIKDLANQS